MGSLRCGIFRPPGWKHPVSTLLECSAYLEPSTARECDTYAACVNAVMNIRVAYEVAYILVIGAGISFIVHGHFGLSVSSVEHWRFGWWLYFWRLYVESLGRAPASPCSVCAVGRHVICCMCTYTSEGTSASGFKIRGASVDFYSLCEKLEPIAKRRVV